MAAPEHGRLSAPLPLTPLEAYLLLSDTPHSSMVIRVVLRLSGECQIDLCAETMRRAITRHPLLCSRVQKIDRRLCWVQGEPEPTIVRHVRGSIFEPECGPMNKSIDLTRSAGLHSSILVMDDGIKLILDAHHAATDGNGIRQAITEWFHLYHCEVHGTPPKLPLLNAAALQTRDQFPQPASIAPISLKDAIRNFLVTVRGRSTRWSGISGNHQPTADTTGSYCVEAILSNTQCDQLRERLAAWKVKLNDLVMICGMSTFAQMAPPGDAGDRITVLNPVDLRLPSDRHLPAANRFGVAFMRRQRSECMNPVSILQGILDEMTYVRSNYIGVEFLKGLATASKIPGGISFFRRLRLFIPSLQSTCLGEVTRGGRRLVPLDNGFPTAGKLRLETTTGYAPHAEHVPLSIATCETNHRITLSVRAAAHVLTPDQTKAFAAALVDQLCSIGLPENAGGSSHRLSST